MHIHFLPENHKSDTVDILLITGDAYIDHPSFGIAIISRVLHSQGYSVAIASQPEYYDKSSLDKLPQPRLFIGITAGNMDSIVSNYTGKRHRRTKDDYTIDGKTHFENGKLIRPDRATITYTSYVKQRFKDTPIVIGGVEASLRRFTHYDYIQQKIRQSILLDSKADILVYSMGEKAVTEIAERLCRNESITGIKGTCIRVNSDDLKNIKTVELPSYKDITQDKTKMIDAVKLIEANMTASHEECVNLYQQQKTGYVLCYKPQPIEQRELDNIYNLPYRRDYPAYCNNIPAYNMIKLSITSHRGCFARCSFCAITSHQGPVLVSRSPDSIKKEVLTLIEKGIVKNTITDIGGPTANMYGLDCKIGWCKNPHCLYPTICNNLVINNKYLEILKDVKKSLNIKNVFVSSGMRHDLALRKKKETEWIIRNATSGHFKIAPEHVVDKILALMRKPAGKTFIEFINVFREIKQKHKLNFFILPYIILSHPGSNDDSVYKLVEIFNQYNIKTYQFQDFTPTPQTMSTAMYISGVDMKNNKITTPNPSSNKNKQRTIFENLMRKKKHKH